MTRSATDIRHYGFRADESLLLDANVWLYLYGPQARANDSRTRIYSAAFKRMLAARSAIWIDVLIMSEFVNRFARLGMNALRQTNFKQFRKSAQFPANAITDAMRRIMSDARPIATGFEALDMDALLGTYESASPDFNDAVLTMLCISKGLTLVTHDADFDDSRVSILTANRKFLS